MIKLKSFLTTRKAIEQKASGKSNTRRWLVGKVGKKSGYTVLSDAARPENKPHHID